MKDNKDIKRMLKYVGGAAGVLVLLGLIKAMLPVILLGISLFIVYRILRRQTNDD